jgi:hypothetical protein
LEKATHPTSVGPAALKAESFVKTTRPARAVARTQAAFVESMECLGVATLPQLDVRNQILPTHHRVSLSVVVSRLADVLRFVNEHCLEGVVAKDADSRYEAGKRSGRWMR